MCSNPWAASDVVQSRSAAIVSRRLPTASVSSMRGFCRENAAISLGAKYLAVERMPIEDASKEWSEEESPYRTGARLRMPRQEAYSAARRAFVDGLSFCVSHSLAAHRPLGSIMRARLHAYPAMSGLRREANGVALREPGSLDEVPA